MTGTTFNAILRVRERAEKMEILDRDVRTLVLDLLNAHKQFTMDWERLAGADDVNFAHDVIGIQRHINRGTGIFDKYYIPRFASAQGENRE